MKRVRQRKTDLEELVARALRKLGHRYRRNVSSLPGSPDFANRSRGWALFVNGCFWHHHRNCPLATVPAANREFWTRKFRDNRRRDARKLRELRRLGMRVGIVWQCQVRDPPTLEARLARFFGRAERKSVRRDDGHDAPSGA